jgi:hypothetical protein
MGGCITLNEKPSCYSAGSWQTEHSRGYHAAKENPCNTIAPLHGSVAAPHASFAVLFSLVEQVYRDVVTAA